MHNQHPLLMIRDDKQKFKFVDDKFCLPYYHIIFRLCPSVFLFLTGALPGQWLLQMDLYQQRIDHRDANGWEECTTDSNGIFNETGLDEVQGVCMIIISVDFAAASAYSHIKCTIFLLNVRLHNIVYS